MNNCKEREYIHLASAFRYWDTSFLPLEHFVLELLKKVDAVLKQQLSMQRLSLRADWPTD